MLFPYTDLANEPTDIQRCFVFVFDVFFFRVRPPRLDQKAVSISDVILRERKEGGKSVGGEVGPHSLEHWTVVIAANWNTTTTSICADLRDSEPENKRRKTPRLCRLDDFEVVNNRRVAEGEHGEILSATELDRRSTYLSDKKAPQVRAMLKLVDGIVGAYERGSSHAGDYLEQLFLIDVGCGRGDLVANLALAFPHSRVVGLDLNHVSLNHARDFARDLGLKNVQFLDSKVEDLDWDELIDHHHGGDHSTLCGRIGPRWTYDSTVEMPQGKEDCGTYTIVVYTDEQQRRLGVDKFGEVIVTPPPARRHHHVVFLGLHACGGLSDAIIDAALRRGAAFCVCTCCFASNPGLRCGASYLTQHGSLVVPKEDKKRKNEPDDCCRGMCTIPTDASANVAGEVDDFPLCSDMWLRIARLAETNEPTVAETARNAAICLNHLRLRAARTCSPYYTSLVELPKEMTHRNHVVVGVPKTNDFFFSSQDHLRHNTL